MVEKGEKGQPERWSKKLWRAYVDEYKEADQSHVESCNRFLDAMLHYQLDAVLTLVRALMHLMVLKGEVENPDHYNTGFDHIDLAEKETVQGKDELDVYRHWYSGRVKWKVLKECVCEKTERKGVMSLDFNTKIEPWFLSACVDLARRALAGDDIPLEVDVYATGGPYEVDEPLPDDADLMIKAGDLMERYLRRGAWRLDEGGMEEVSIDTVRHSYESRKGYINRVLELVETQLLLGMVHADQVTHNPKVTLQGRKIDPEGRHEEILVRLMFGEQRRVIAESIKDCLPDGDPEREVSRRAKEIAEHLGFLPTGEEIP